MLHKPVSIKLLGACLALPSLVVNGLPVLSGELPMSDAIRNLHRQCRMRPAATVRRG